MEVDGNGLEWKVGWIGVGGRVDRSEWKWIGVDGSGWI